MLISSWSGGGSVVLTIAISASSENSSTWHLRDAREIMRVAENSQCLRGITPITFMHIGRYMTLRFGVEARCEAGLRPAGSNNKIFWGCAPGSGLALSTLFQAR